MAKLNQQQQEAYQQQLDRGQSFEELIRTKGWGYVKAWYQAKIQQFASGLLIQDTKPISDFENERRELIGLRKLMGIIDNDLEVTRKEYTKNEKAGPVAKE